MGGGLEAPEAVLAGAVGEGERRLHAAPHQLHAQLRRVPGHASAHHLLSPSSSPPSSPQTIPWALMRTGLTSLRGWLRV